MNLLRVARTGSTNADLRDLAEQGAPHGTALLADEQTAGRGRMGRTWEAPAGTAVLLSVLLRPRLLPRQVPLLCLGAAVAAAEACPVLRIKWPNDLLGPDGRKVGGILAEMELGEGGVRYVILGIGLNLVAAPPIPTAAPLVDYADPPDRLALAEELTRGILAVSDELERGTDGMLARWRSLSATLGREVEVGEVRGVAEDVDSDGALWVRTSRGRRRVLAGDVRMVGEAFPARAHVLRPST